MDKVITNFQKYDDDELSDVAADVVKGITGNAFFTSPQPPVADLEAASAAYTAAKTNAHRGGPEQTAIKQAAQNTLDRLLGQMGRYVNDAVPETLPDDERRIRLGSSGFPMAKEPQPVGELPKVTGFSVKPGPVPATIDARLTPIKNVKGYQYEHTEAPITASSVWHTTFGGTSKHRYEGLTSGQQYGFRASGLRSGQGLVYSDVLLSYVL